MKEFVSAGIQEALRQRLVAAVTEVCRDETFYLEKMRIEGTLCIVSDRNSFIVFQITELIGSKNNEELAPQKNSSSSESEHHESNQSANNSNLWLDETERSNSVETDQNADLQSDQNLQSCSEKDNSHVNSNIVPISQFTSALNNAKKAPVNRPNTRLRRRIACEDNNENSNNIEVNRAPSGELIQTIKEELPEFNLEDSMADDTSGNTEDVNLLKMSSGVDLSSFDLDDNMKNKRRPYKARGGINSYAFSGRCYEEIYVRTPHGLYRYMCRLCNSMFKIRNGLYEHLNGHFGRRPHACRQCDARFAHHSSLHNHVRNKHSLQTEEEKQAALRHCCNTCGRRFRYPSELERHKAVHDEFPVHATQSSSFVLGDTSGNRQITSASLCQQQDANNFDFQILDHLAAFNAIPNGDTTRINIGTS